MLLLVDLAYFVLHEPLVEHEDFYMFERVEQLV